MTPWILALLPALLQPLIFLGYRRTLNAKSMEVKRLYSEKAKDLHNQAFRGEPGELFKSMYSDFLYAIPLAINAGLVVLAAVAMLAGVGWAPAGIHEGVVQKFAVVPAPVFSGFVGAYVWGLWDTIQRAQLASLTPHSLHHIWLRLLIGATLAPLMVLALANEFRMPVAFFLAGIPVATLKGYGEKMGMRPFNLEAAPRFSEGPTLQNLQGLTAEVVEDLTGAGISSTQHLAHADPQSVLLHTNLRWKVILDLIDQALLFNYIGDQLPAYR